VTVDPKVLEYNRRYVDTGLAAASEPYRGITTDGAIVPGLFPIQRTGVSTQPLREAAVAFLETLSAEQQAATLFGIDAMEWRMWSNIHRTLMRHGSCLGELGPVARGRAFDLLRASLSAGGFNTARDVMRLNETLAELTDKPEEYGERYYWLSVMGQPSESEPWGWQLDGHHLNLNFFVLGNQVVFSPAFVGSEIVAAEAGRYAGTRVLAAEEGRGLELARGLSGAQREAAVLGSELPRHMYADAFRDNFELRYEGLPFGQLSGVQQGLLMGLLDVYLGRMRTGDAEVKAREVRQHLDSLHFAWIGGMDDDSAFYYRLHSPVIMVEFEHQRGQALPPFDRHTKVHVHTVVRTPNGNDYGKDLLRQHHQAQRH
jgi:hypothetical protein